MAIGPSSCINVQQTIALESGYKKEWLIFSEEQHNLFNRSRVTTSSLLILVATTNSIGGYNKIANPLVIAQKIIPLAYVLRIL